MSRTRLFIPFLLVFVFATAPFTSADEFLVASWNVNNLFDTEDDPAVKGDEEYTPDADKQWTTERLEIRLNNLASIISKMNDGKGPDVLGLCEVENRKVVEMLIDKLRPLGRKYEIVHKDSPSERGIDCAIVYDSGVFTLATSKFHHVDAENTRDIVEAKLRRNTSDLFVFMDHWPSRHHEESFRIKAADVLRTRVDEILSADPKADIIMLGDFNDESEDPSIRDHLRAATSDSSLPPGALFDTTAHIKAAGKGTMVYNNKWDLLDHIIVSAGLLDSTGFRLKKDSAQRLEYPELFFRPRGKGAIPRPNESYTENRFHKTGYSDHLPVVCVIAQ